MSLDCAIFENVHVHDVLYFYSADDDRCRYHLAEVVRRPRDDGERGLCFVMVKTPICEDRRK